MVQMVAMKRAAGSSGKAAKKAKTDDVGPKIKELHDIIANTECDVPGPDGNKKMLLSALPHALSAPTDVRHGYQTTVAKMIGEVMTGWVTKWEKKVAESKSHLDTAESDKTAAEATQEGATTSLASQKEDVKKKKEELKAATEANKTSKEALTAADTEVKDFDKELHKTIDKKTHIEETYNQNFLVMKSAESVGAGDARSHVSKIMHTLKEISTEPSLSLAIAPALKKTPAERGDFDKIAIDGVEEHFKSAIAKLTGEITTADATKATKVATATDCKTAHDATEAKRQECIAALKASQEAQAEKESSLSAAEKNVDTATKAANKASKENTHEQHGLDKAKGNLASFQFLLERTTPPPEEPEQLTEG